jgi:hypothetical protein
MNHQIQSSLLVQLARANKGILKQKSSLLGTLQTKFGTDKTIELFTKKCSIVQASIGQHYRHSMDHVELAALVAFASINKQEMGLGHLSSTVNNNDKSAVMNKTMDEEPITINYDLRVRGGTLEKDVEEAKRRIDSVHEILDQVENSAITCSPTIHGKDLLTCTEETVYASFMLTGDSGDPEMRLTSTIGRELGFAAHHALHHLAMVKIIAIHTIGLKDEELGLGFGKAPSTIRFESGARAD